MNKPTMQDIADALSVSRISIWKALNNRPGISEKLREKAINEAVKIGYINPINDLNQTGVQAATKNIAAVVSRPESSYFWMQIIHEIAKKLSHYGANLIYTYLPPHHSDGDPLPKSLSDDSLSGIIILNVYSDRQLKMLANLSLPKVFLDTVPNVPFEQLCGDLVMIEGRSTVKRITKSLLKNGRTKLGFIGDINYAQTNMDRYLGFLDAHNELSLTNNKLLNMTDPLHLTTHYKQISQFLDSLKTMPDGFICASDYIAHFVQQYFTEHGIAQETVCLTGFDNNTEYANVANKITTVNVQTKSLGERLANKIMYATDHPHSPFELSYISSEILREPGLPKAAGRFPQR